MFRLLSGFFVLNSITFVLRNTLRNDSEGICLFTDMQTIPRAEALRSSYSRKMEGPLLTG